MQKTKDDISKTGLPTNFYGGTILSPVVITITTSKLIYCKKNLFSQKKHVVVIHLDSIDSLEYKHSDKSIIFSALGEKRKLLCRGFSQKSNMKIQQLIISTSKTV